MPTLFGQQIEPDFDLETEQRNDRVGWSLWVVFGAWAVYLSFGGHFAVEFFQGGVATVLCYGANFYANHRSDLSKLWLWKAVSASIPMHLGYLFLLSWSDKVAPQAMTKALVFMPALTVGFVLESIVIDHLIAFFKPVQQLPIHFK